MANTGRLHGGGSIYTALVRMERSLSYRQKEEHSYRAKDMDKRLEIVVRL
jgi:hypothetical protein